MSEDYNTVTSQLNICLVWKTCQNLQNVLCTCINIHICVYLHTNLWFLQQIHQNRRQLLSIQVLQQFSFFIWQTDGFRIYKGKHRHKCRWDNCGTQTTKTHFGGICLIVFSYRIHFCPWALKSSLHSQGTSWPLDTIQTPETPASPVDSRFSSNSSERRQKRNTCKKQNPLKYAIVFTQIYLEFKLSFLKENSTGKLLKAEMIT